MRFGILDSSKLPLLMSPALSHSGGLLPQTLASSRNMNTKYSHEKSVENIFRENFAAAARSLNHTFIAASLDGQDRLAGADYLFSSQSKYAIVEFKYREDNLPSEIKKEKRHLLCQGLHFDPYAHSLHDKCHFAAWSNNTAEIYIETNIYFNEVCNKQFWGDRFPYIDSPAPQRRLTENQFIDNFLAGCEGADFNQFEEYLKWLLQLGDDSNTNGYLELLISNPFNQRAAGLPFTSVRSMHTWIEVNKPDLTPTYPPSGGSFPHGPGG